MLLNGKMYRTIPDDQGNHFLAFLSTFYVKQRS